jgi:NitT/TauT family transport system substrate-binding protein
MLRSHTHGHHPIGADLKQEIARYIEELKGISVIKPNTNADRFSEKVYANVLS